MSSIPFETVINRNSNVVLNAFAGYRNSSGNLSSFWRADTKNKTIPSTLSREKQLHDCLTQIRRFKLEDFNNLIILTDDEALRASNLFHNYFPDKNIEIVKTESSLHSLCLSSNYLDSYQHCLVILVEYSKTESATHVATLCKKNSLEHPIVSLDTLMVGKPSMTEAQISYGLKTYPGLLKTNSTGYLPQIDKAVKTSKLAIQYDASYKGLIASLVEAVLAIVNKTMKKGDHSNYPDFEKFTFQKSSLLESDRIWVQPKSQERGINERVAAIVYASETIDSFITLKEIHSEPGYNYSYSFWQNPSEVFLLGSDSLSLLLKEVNALKSYIERSPIESLTELAFSINSKLSDNKGDHRLAIVATDASDLSKKLKLAVESLDTGPNTIHNEALGIFYRNSNSRLDGKVAYLLPGLGSSYSGMLQELYLSDPLTELAFNTLDSIALNYPESGCPSDFIFPGSESDHKSSKSLIKADFAVTAVLISSFALDSQLKEYGLNPDVYMGLSTGELGVYLLNGYSKIEQAAPLFYKLNIEVARNIPHDELRNLASINAFCSCEKLNEIIAENNLAVYVIADLSPQHAMVTGDKTSIETLVDLLKNRSIVSLPMAAPIPYHTPLVDCTLSDEMACEFKDSLDFSKITIPSWSCSTASASPDTEVEIEQLAKTMFKKKIKLKETIEAMYADGVRTFIEVGPNGVLTSKVKEILKDQDHLAIASNLSNKNSITQIQNVIALIFANGKSPTLEAWFKRSKANQGNNNFNLPGAFNGKNNEPKDALVKNYFETLNKFFQSSLDSQNQLLKEYLEIKNNSKPIKLNRKFLPVSSLEQNQYTIVSWLECNPETISDAQLSNLIKMYLSAREVQLIKDKYKNRTRFVQSLLGRIAAKDAILSLHKRYSLPDLESKQIEILQDDSGKPEVKLPTSLANNDLMISISHSQGLVCALASNSNQTQNIGVDVEKLRELKEDLPEFVLAKGEYQNLEMLYPDQRARNNEFLRIWTTKEAAFKALGGRSLKDYIWNSKNLDNNLTELSFKDSIVPVYSFILGQYVISYTLGIEQVKQVSKI